MDFGSFREAAEAFDVGYDWLRRAVTQGVAWTRKDNPAVTKLATFFGVRQEEIWEEPGEVFRMAVLAKAKPDYYARCLTLEAVLRHYGKNRPSLLDTCLDVIEHYKQKIDRPDMESPDHCYIIVEAADFGASRIQGSSSDWIDVAVEKRLSQLRLLPKREILEEVVQARIARLKRQESLNFFSSPEYWEHLAKPKIVQMLMHVFMDALQDDGGAAVDDETMTKLAVVAEGYAQKLWDGEYRPSKDAASQKSSPKKK